MNDNDSDDNDYYSRWIEYGLIASVIIVCSVGVYLTIAEEPTVKNFIQHLVQHVQDPAESN